MENWIARPHIETPTHASELSPDRPLSDASADALGHAAFAAHLASVIATLSPKDGITVGLYGDPGGGRTTALNLTRAALREHPAAAKWTVVDWNPWLLSGGADLEQRFVQLLASAALGASSDQLPDPTQIPALLAKVASTLGSGDKRVVVLIDDADRLVPDRLAELLRLLASAAPIANLVFVIVAQPRPGRRRWRSTRRCSSRSTCRWPTVRCCSRCSSTGLSRC